MENEERKAITYDYKTVRVSRAMEAMLADAYENLGWEVTSTTMAEGGLNYVNISFKRDRKVEHKTELIKIQEKIDVILADIDKVQRQKKSAGVAEGITVGVLGALTFGGGMSMTMLLEGVGYMIGGIALGVVGIGIGLLGWLTHNKIQKRKLAKLEPIYQSDLDKLSDLCEEAAQLLK